MDSDTTYLFHLLLYYVVLFFAVGLLARVSSSEKSLHRSLETGLIWPILLGGPVLIVPAVLPLLVSWEAPLIDWVAFDPEVGPFLYGIYGATFVFPVLLALLWGYRLIRWLNGGGLVPRKTDVISPSACRNKNDIESVMLCVSKKCEKLLSDWYGAEGKGLHEKVSSIEAELDPQDAKDLRFLASVRNQVTHDEEFDTSSVNRRDILETAVSVIHRIADKKGAVIGSARFATLGGVPGSGLLLFPLSIFLGFSYVTGLLTAVGLGLGAVFTAVILIVQI